MDWDIPRYWDSDGTLRNADEYGEPSADDLELGDSFLIHFVDADDVDHYYWVHGGIDLSQYDSIDDAIADVIDALADRYGIST